MSSFLQRGLSGIIYVILFVSAILYSKYTYLALVTVFAVFSLIEFQKLLKFKDIVSYLILAAFCFYAVLNEPIELLNQVLLVLVLFSSFQLTLFLFGKKENYPTKFIEKLDLCVRYLVFSYGFIMLLPFIDFMYQEMVILSLVIFIWTNDSFAYLIGKNFGKRKLFERVSPRKTIEGFVGGIIFTIVAAIVISYYSDLFSLFHWIILSLITSILGTVGDLVESKFKRRAKVKDSGTIMPGHGGILDRLDSLLFVAPFVYLYIHFII